MVTAVLFGLFAVLLLIGAPIAVCLGMSSVAAMVVMGHEQEHVSNAYRKAELGGGEVERASVRLKTDICPECGRTYISGGVTTTQIKYYNEGNPYQKDMKESDAVNKYRGANVDLDQ